MTTHYDLAIIGSGSGNSIINDDFAGQRVAILEQGTFGGTCLNVGCIPTKMFVYPADIAHFAAHGDRLGLETTFDGARWREIRDRIFRRIDPISDAGRSWRINGNDNVDVYEGRARFVDVRTLDTGTGVTITADQVVIAAGSRAVIPTIEGLESVEHHTSDTVMRLETLPERLMILGGGFIAAEFAHIFSALGSQVTIVVRSEAMLREQDDDISARFTELASERWDVRLNTLINKVEEYDEGLRAFLDDDTTLEFDTLLVATGRSPNSDALDLDRTGVQTENGLVMVDEHQQTNVPGIWALGDISNEFQLKHVANHEARVVQHNLLHPDDLRSTTHDAVPSAVFSYPQVASVGLTEQAAIARGVGYVSSRQSYGDTAYGWAMEDTTSFAKVLVDPVTGLLLGAHLIGPQASNLIQPLIQAMSFGQTAHDVARGQYWIHPALMEVVENVLLGVNTDEPVMVTPG